MLLTLKHEARRAGFVMPAPERARKVCVCVCVCVCEGRERERVLGS